MKRCYESEKSLLSYNSMINSTADLPFAFSYGKVEYRGFDKTIFNEIKRTRKEIDSVIYDTAVFDKDGLIITLNAIYYKTHGAYEFFVSFENASDKNSEIIEDCRCEAEYKGADPVLSGIYGDHVKLYEPYSYDLTKQSVNFLSNHGRATHITFPYFDLSCGDGGVLLAIGWAGTWSADFIKTFCGVKYTARYAPGIKTYLKPNEKIRTASFVFAPYYTKDEYRISNYWRSFFVECIMPKADGKGNKIKPFSTCCLAKDTGHPNSDGSISERYDTWRRSLEKMKEEGIKPDFRWIDAGWYLRPDLTSAEPFLPGKDWGDSIGTWTPDPAKWPGDSLLQSTSYARESGMKTLLWFEPERITDADSMEKNFSYDKAWAMIDSGSSASNNIGDPDCLDYTAARICKTLFDNRIELYREDCNADPVYCFEYFDKKEGDDRRGITESKFIASHYELWDRIISCTLSYGGCGFVDSCASGGGRNDIESMKRGVPLLRSDNDRTTTSLRLSMTSSFNKWIPFCGAATMEKNDQLSSEGVSDKYVWRASYLPALNLDGRFYTDPDRDFDAMRDGINEWKTKVAPYLLKEFYTLTSWHKGDDDSCFAAYAFYDPDEEKGVLLAFRQQNCEASSLTVPLPFEKDCALKLCDADSGKIYEASKSITLKFKEKRTSRLLTFDIVR